MRATFWITAFVLLVITAASSNLGAAEPATQPEHKPPQAAEKLEPYECGSVTRLHTLDGVFLASQPAAEDFKMAKAGGIKTVINLRHHGETNWSEADLLAELGMQYYNVPFKVPDELTDEVFVQVRELLNDKANKPVLLHCSSANRVAAIWLAHRVLDGGLSFEEAKAEAKTVGLKLPAYEARAKAHIESVQKK